MINLIWDLDGTLVDSQKEILNTLELAFLDSSLNISQTINPIRIGPPLDVMIKKSFPEEIITDEKLSEILSHFRRRYNSGGFKMTCAFPGIDLIIRDTDKFAHHIVTNKPHETSVQLIKKLGWQRSISSLKAPLLNKTSKKTKTQYFSEIIGEYGNDNSVFIGIGDMITDCTAARENNIVSAGVLWGSGTREELSRCCDYLFDNVKKLNNFLGNFS
ncbi:MAG: HAD family hydrolase [Treponema sp.]|nr:HAD family hydrolase [Treponema sp.]